MNTELKITNNEKSKVFDSLWLGLLFVDTLDPPYPKFRSAPCSHRRIRCHGRSAFLWAILPIMLALVLCGCKTGPMGDSVGQAQQSLISRAIYSFDFQGDGDRAPWGEIVTRTFVVPMEEGRGYTLAFELKTHGVDPLLGSEGDLRKVVVMGLSHDLVPTGRIFETGYSVTNELIGVVPVHGARTTVILRRELDPAVVLLWEEHGVNVPLTPTYTLTGFPSEGDFVHDRRALHSDHPGRVEGATYIFRAVGGRVADGNDFLVVAERRRQAPDSLMTELAVLKVDATRFVVTNEQRLTSSVVIPSSFGDPYVGLTCTQMAYGAEDGWLVAHKYSLGGVDDIRGYLIDSSLNLVHAQPYKSYARADAGRRLGRFAIAGSRYRLTSGLYALVVEQIATDLPQVTLESHVFEYNGTTGGSGNVFGVNQRNLGPSFGAPVLVQNTGSHSQWILIDYGYEDTASPLELRKLGAHASAYYREEIGRDGAVAPSITYDNVHDETVYAYASQSAQAVVTGKLSRWEPRGSTILGDGTSAGEIGPRFFSGLNNVDTVTFPRVPIAGHRFFTMTLDLPFSDLAQNLRLAVSSRYTLADGSPRPDMLVPGARRFPVPTSAQTGGHVELRLPLDEYSLRGLFTEAQPGFSQFGLIRWPHDLYTQFEWEEPIVNPLAGIRYRSRYSDVLHIRIGL